MAHTGSLQVRAPPLGEQLQHWMLRRAAPRLASSLRRLPVWPGLWPSALLEPAGPALGCIAF